MSEFLNNLRFPTGLDEGDLLSWVEGEPLHASKRAAIATWLAREPELARQVEAMRSDRVLIKAMGDEAAPAGLLSAIAGQLEPLLERQMLLGLADGKDLIDGPPVSVVRPQKQGVLASIFADRMGRRIALAAGLLLVVGGTTYFMAQALTTQGRPPRSSHTLALKQETGTPETTLADAGAAAQPEAGRGAPDSMLKAAGDPQAMRMAEVPEPAAPLAPFTDENPEFEIAGAIEPPKMGPFPIDGPIDAVRAAELAAEGRLVVRVLADEEQLIRNPDKIALRLRKAPPVDRSGWNVEGEAPAALASAVAQPFPAEAPARLREPQLPIMVGIVDSERYPEIPPAVLYGPPKPQLAAALAQGPKVFSVQARIEPVNLSKLRDTLAGAGGEVVFEEAASPLPEVGEPALSPQAILWWGQKPDAWARWARVPVVVDIQR
jgi:hypothetical protein